MMPEESLPVEKTQDLRILERLAVVETALGREREKRREERKRQNLPLVGPNFCVVCKTVRLDNDSVGVTCGDPQCVSHVIESLDSLDATEKRCNEADAMQGVLEAVAFAFDGTSISDEDVAYNSKLCEAVEDEVIPGITQVVERLAKMLGIDISTSPSLITELEWIEEKVIALSSAVSTLEEAVVSTS